MEMISAAYTDLAYLGGTRAVATTPIIGQPVEPYAEVYVPGAEPIRDGEIRVTVLGSGNPPPTRAQASVLSWWRWATRSATCSSSMSAAVPWPTS